MNLNEYQKIDFVYKANLEINGQVYQSKKTFSSYKEAWKYCVKNSPKNKFCEFFVTELPELNIIQPINGPEESLSELKKVFNINDSKN